VFFPENSGKVPDKPALSFVVLAPEQTMEDEKRVKAFIDGVIREHGSSSRTYKSGLVFIVANSVSTLNESARRVLAWEEIEKELPGMSVDKTQISQLEENIKKSRRDLKEGVWRCYNNVALLGKSNEVRFIDLGNMHSSAAASIIQFIINELMHVDEIQTGIGPSLLVRNWPPAIPEWNTKAVRDAFFASPLFPRLLNADSVKETIARGVSNGQLAYVGKTGSGKYHPFNFKRSITAFDVEISEEMFIITKETAEAYEKAATQPSTTLNPIPDLFPSDGSPVNPPKTQPVGATPAPKPSDTQSGPEPTQLTLGLTWSGEVPSQKWMNFYTKVLTKLGVGNDLSLNVKVKCNPKGGLSKQKIEEIKSALRELGLDDNFEE